jgi:hypothetical protein
MTAKPLLDFLVTFKIEKNLLCILMQVEPFKIKRSSCPFQKFQKLVYWIFFQIGSNPCCVQKLYQRNLKSKWHLNDIISHLSNLFHTILVVKKYRSWSCANSLNIDINLYFHIYLSISFLISPKHPMRQTIRSNFMVDLLWPLGTFSCPFVLGMEVSRPCLASCIQYSYLSPSLFPSHPLICWPPISIRPLPRSPPWPRKPETMAGRAEPSPLSVPCSWWPPILDSKKNRARQPETSRHWPPLRSLKPYQARHQLCHVLFALYRPCSNGRQFIEHLAGTAWAPSLRADWPPSKAAPRQRPLPKAIQSLERRPLFSLSRCSCPCSPCAVARQRVPRLGSAPVVSK